MPRSKRGVRLTPSGWKRLQEAIQQWQDRENDGVRYTIEALSDRTGLDPTTISKVLDRELGVDRRSLSRVFSSFKLELKPNDYNKLNPTLQPLHRQAHLSQQQNFQEAPNIPIFLGRDRELKQLQQWIVQDDCRLLTIVGIGGVGKTALSVKLGKEIVSHFEYICWKTLRDAPPLLDLLGSLLQFFSHGKETDLPKDSKYRIKRLLEYFRSSRCLLVLDNIESILAAGNLAGKYRSSYKDYGEFFRQIGEGNHQSCLLLTSREKPQEIALLAGNKLPGVQAPIRSLQLEGLTVEDIRGILANKGVFNSSDRDWEILVKKYSGNPLYLKIIATTIKDLFDGDIAKFIAQETGVFGDICNILSLQLNRVSDLEKSIIYWLANARETVEISELKEDLLLPVDLGELLDALQSLLRRGLIETKESRFTLQPVVMEYVTTVLKQQICQEIVTGKISLLVSHALMKATAPDYLKDAQIRLIITPIIDNLKRLIGTPKQIELHLTSISNCLRGKPSYQTGYAAGNIINILTQIFPVIENLDFSELTIWQADLQGRVLKQVNFQNSNFNKSIFSQNFEMVLALAFTKNSQLLATGGINGEICLWEWQSDRQLLNFPGHSNIVTVIAFSNDGQLIASASLDKSIKIWQTNHGSCLKQINLNLNIQQLIFSPDGERIFASSGQKILSWDFQTNICNVFSEQTSYISFFTIDESGKKLAIGTIDGKISIWNIDRAEAITHLKFNNSLVLSINLGNPNLAVTVADQIIRIWDINTAKCLQTLPEQNNKISLVALSNNGVLLASSGGDRTVKLWDVNTGKYLQTLAGHILGINKIAFDPNSKIVATSSVDRTVKLWDINNGKCLKTWQGRTDFINTVVFSNNLLISSSQYGIKFWDINEEKCLKTIKNNCNSIAITPDGKMLAWGQIGNTGSIVKIQQIEGSLNNNTNELILRGHTDSIWSVVFSPDGKILASGSRDKTIKLWDVARGEYIKTISVNDIVLSIVFSPDGNTLASCCAHLNIKLWDVATEKCARTITERGVYTIAFSPDGSILASGNTDGTIKLWNVSDGQCISILKQHNQAVTSLIFNPKENILASGSKDGNVKLWDIIGKNCLATLSNGKNTIWSIAINPSENLLATGCDEQTIKLWDLDTGNLLKNLKSDRPFQDVNITGAIGLTSATRGNLIALGAAL